MDIQDYRSAGQLRIPGGENQEVRKVMHVDKIIPAPPMAAHDPPRGHHQKSHQRPQEGGSRLLSFTEAILNPEHFNTKEHLFPWHLRSSSESEHLNGIAPLNQRLRITRHSTVGLVKGMGDHADVPR